MNISSPDILPVYKKLEANYEYDYIIAGAGCAGLSLLLRMIESRRFSKKKILLIDKAGTKRNDRTWCFWEKENGFFDYLVYKKWDRILFRSETFSGEFDINPYEYKMIRGIDFYDQCFSIISEQQNITIEYAEVERIESVKDGALLWRNGQPIKARYIFNSILFQQPACTGKHHLLLQHFKGWVIETEEPVISDTIATLMDFKIDQQNGTAFVYVMPLSGRKALVEYTFISEKVEKNEIYEEGLKDYIRNFLNGGGYKVIETEEGIIPMTNYPFSTVEGNIINIGTVGGQTRASSGYTFQFIQKRTKAIVEAMLISNTPFTKKGLIGERAKFYDSVLLNILSNKLVSGDGIFTKLFQRNPAASIFKFLDAETSLTEDFLVIKTLPTWIFLKAALKELLR